MQRAQAEMIEVNDLRALADSELLYSPKTPVFDFLSKKGKVSIIDFNKNTSKIWIFPFSNQEHNDSYTYTDPHPDFLKAVDPTDIRQKLSDISQISQRYYNDRFQKERTFYFPKNLYAKISIALSVIGFGALMFWIQNGGNLGTNTGSLRPVIPFLLMIPWRDLISALPTGDHSHVGRTV